MNRFSSIHRSIEAHRLGCSGTLGNLHWPAKPKSIPLLFASAEKCRLQKRNRPQDVGSFRLVAVTSAQPVQPLFTGCFFPPVRAFAIRLLTAFERLSAFFRVE